MANGNNSQAPNPGLLPSGSTAATTIGGAIAFVTMKILHLKGIDLGADTELALALIFSSAIGYLPKSGRARSADARTRYTDIVPTEKPRSGDTA